MKHFTRMKYKVIQIIQFTINNYYIHAELCIFFLVMVLVDFIHSATSYLEFLTSKKYQKKYCNSNLLNLGRMQTSSEKRMIVKRISNIEQEEELN